MKPIERLQAAIRELERLKEMSTPGPWSHLYGPNYSTIEIETDAGVRPIAMFGLRREDAELAIVLQRTVAPLLELLRAAAAAKPVALGEAIDRSPHLDAALTVADAILGRPKDRPAEGSNHG